MKLHCSYLFNTNIMNENSEEYLMMCVFINFDILCMSYKVIKKLKHHKYFVNAKHNIDLLHLFRYIDNNNQH